MSVQLTPEQFALLTDTSGNTPEAVERIKRIIDGLRTHSTEEIMAKKDEIEVQPDDAKVTTKSETKKKGPTKAAKLEAENKALKAKLKRIKEAFPNNGHIQRLCRD